MPGRAAPATSAPTSRRAGSERRNFRQTPPRSISRGRASCRRRRYTSRTNGEAKNAAWRPQLSLERFRLGKGWISGAYGRAWSPAPRPYAAPRLVLDPLALFRQCRTSARAGSSRPRRCLLYTSDAADEEDSVDLGGRRIIKKKKIQQQTQKHKQRPEQR